MTAKGSAYWPVGEQYFFNLAAVGILKLPFKQPYITQEFIGYDDQFLQGYEYYVIDGVAGGYMKGNNYKTYRKYPFQHSLQKD